MSKIKKQVKLLEAEGVFLGGPVEFFEVAGQNLLSTLIHEGLELDSKVLDIGCGCLRCGYRLINYLDNGSYFGIEPNVKMLSAGIKILLTESEVANKEPSFDNNLDFDFEVFDTKFDFFVARSIWTHASKQQIRVMPDSYKKTTTQKGVFLASYIRSGFLKRDYKGDGWVGKSHSCDRAGIVAHDLNWIQNECYLRGLCAKEISDHEFNFGNQVWIRITLD